MRDRSTVGTDHLRTVGGLRLARGDDLGSGGAEGAVQHRIDGLRVTVLIELLHMFFEILE